MEGRPAMRLADEESDTKTWCDWALGSLES